MHLNLRLGVLIMLGNKQTQEAGDNSQLLQVSAINVYNGIDEKRAREIVDEKLNEVIKEYSQEAHSIAQSRIQLFSNDLIPKLVKENLMDNLKDPSIQVLLYDAQKAAASTERPVDYSLLSELLIHRVKKGNDRSIRAGISRAIKIVDEISDEALLGLTIAHSVVQFLPSTGNIQDGIETLDNLFGKVIYNLPPTESTWIDDLDILDAIRINQLSGLKKIDQIYPEFLSGYVDVGIDELTEDYQKAITIIKEANLPEDILCNHELRQGYVRLRILNLNRLDLVTISGYKLDFNGQLISVPFQIQLSDDQKHAIRNIYELYNKNPDLRNENIVKFMNLWDEFENLKKLKNWWDSIPVSFKITSVGRVLAHANAQRCNPILPALN